VTVWVTDRAHLVGSPFAPRLVHLSVETLWLAVIVGLLDGAGHP
jgi:hypothetical protein